MSRFPIPAADAAAPFQTEIIIRRSRFLTHCAHTPGMEAARAFVEQIRTKHADATHNCWAFVAGAPGHSGQVGFSDDGEPHGTAGRPMLQVSLPRRYLSLKKYRKQLYPDLPEKQYPQNIHSGSHYTKSVSDNLPK